MVQTPVGHLWRLWELHFRHTHTHTWLHPLHSTPSSSPAPIHPTSPHPRLLHSQSPLSLSNRATLSLPLSVKPTNPAPSRYLRGDNHGNSSTVGTGHQLTKIDSRKMEGKKERKASLHPRSPVGMFVYRRSMRSSRQTGTQAPSPLISSSNKGNTGLLERAHSLISAIHVAVLVMGETHQTLSFSHTSDGLC